MRVFHWSFQHTQHVYISENVLLWYTYFFRPYVSYYTEDSLRAKIYIYGTINDYENPPPDTPLPKESPILDFQNFAAPSYTRSFTFKRCESDPLHGI